MATQGRPNVNLLPIAGTEVTRAREQEQAVGLQAALARLRAQAQAAELQERAQQFDENALLRRESLALDSQLRNQELSLRRSQFQQGQQEFQFRSQQDVARFGLAERQLGISEQQLERDAKRDEESARRFESEFGLREQKFTAQEAALIREEKRKDRTEAEKKFSALLRQFQQDAPFIVDPDLPPGQRFSANPEAVTRLEQLRPLAEEFFGRAVSLQELMAFVNPDTTRRIREIQRQEANQELASRGRQIQQQETLSRIQRNERVAGRAGRARPVQEIAAKQDLELAARTELQAQKDFNSGVIDQAEFDRQRNLAQQTRERGLASLRQIAAPQGPAIQITPQERLQQIEQGFPALPSILGGRTAPAAAGVPAEPTPVAEPGAPPAEPGQRRVVPNELQSIQQTNKFLRELREERQGFRTPTLATQTLTPTDQQALGAFTQNGLAIIDKEATGEFLGTLVTKIDDEVKKQEAAWAERKLTPPERVIEALNNRRTELKTMQENNEQQINEIRRGQQGAFESMTGDAMLVLNARLKNESSQINERVLLLQERQQEATGPRKAELQQEINQNNRVLAHLQKSRAEVSDRSNQFVKESFNLDVAASVTLNTLGPGRAMDPEVRGIMEDLRANTDPVLSEDFGTVSFITAGIGGNSREVRRFRGAQVIQVHREGAFSEFNRALRKQNPDRITREWTFRLKRMMPLSQRELLDRAIDSLDQVLETTNRERVQAKQTPLEELGKEELKDVARDALGGSPNFNIPPQNPENVMAYAALLMSRGIPELEVWETVRDFDYYRLFPRPRPSKRPPQEVISSAFNLDRFARGLQ